jgi:tight adherence protein B
MATPLLALGALALASASNQPPVLAVLFVAVLGAMPTIYLHWLKHKRIAKLVRQLPDTFELISRSLRAGHAFSVGLKLVGDEAPDPVGLEFRRAFDEVAMGVALPKALENITNRVDSLDLRFFVTAVVVQRETGGNLAEIIDSLAAMIRRRFELQMKVNALSAEGRFSGMILFGLPIVIGLLLFEMNPEYIGLLFTDPIGQNLVMIGSFLMVTGAIVMKRLIAIRV